MQFLKTQFSAKSPRIMWPARNQEYSGLKWTPCITIDIVNILFISLY